MYLTIILTCNCPVSLFRLFFIDHGIGKCQERRRFPHEVNSRDELPTIRVVIFRRSSNEALCSPNGRRHLLSTRCVIVSITMQYMRLIDFDSRATKFSSRGPKRGKDPHPQVCSSPLAHHPMKKLLVFCQTICFLRFVRNCRCVLGGGGSDGLFRNKC